MPSDIAPFIPALRAAKLAESQARGRLLGVHASLHASLHASVWRLAVHCGGMDLQLSRTLRKQDGAARRRRKRAPALIVLLQGRCPWVGSSRHRLADVDDVLIGRGPGNAQRGIEKGVRRLRLSIADPLLSSEHAQVRRSGAQCQLIDLDSTNGTLVNGEAIDRRVLQEGDRIELGDTTLLFRAAVEYQASDPADAAPDPDASELVSLIPALQEQFDELRTVAASGLTILLLGATGTGKEVLARAIHLIAERTGELVAVNCAALPDALIERELFGHQKGAFSGADESKAGLVTAADGGTLFLDEIGDLSSAAQAVLLRTLQERVVRPVGATSTKPVDFRLLAATHQDLEEMVREGSFREDLLARLAVHVVHLPALQDRLDDLGTTVAALMRRLDPTHAARIDGEAARELIAHHWPRNVRELEHTLSAALVRAVDGVIEPEHLSISSGSRESRRPDPGLDPDQRARRQELIQLLQEHGGNISAVARALGKVRSQVQRWLRRYDIDAGEYRAEGNR